jgi:hypothetical protein
LGYRAPRRRPWMRRAAASGSGPRACAPPAGQVGMARWAVGEAGGDQQLWVGAHRAPQLGRAGTVRWALRKIVGEKARRCGLH